MRWREPSEKGAHMQLACPGRCSPGEWGEAGCTPVRLLPASLALVPSLRVLSFGTGTSDCCCAPLAAAAVAAAVEACSGCRSRGALKLTGSSMEGDDGGLALRMVARPSST